MAALPVKEYLKSISAKHPAHEVFESGVAKDVQWVGVATLAHLLQHKQPFDEPILQLKREIGEWCRDNCRGTFVFLSRWRTVGFSNDKDAIAFALRWG